MKTQNIMIVGVGGQGTLLASRLLGHILPGMGYDVKISEVHGMAQRGGSVVTFVRFGDQVAEPIVHEGNADVLIAFEKLEALRCVECGMCTYICPSKIEVTDNMARAKRRLNLAMKKRNATRNALITSVIAIMLCVSSKSLSIL